MTQGSVKSELVESHLEATANSQTGQQPTEHSHGPARALAATFVAMFCLVGIGLWGLPFYYDFMVQQFAWSRAQVTSGMPSANC